MLSKYNSLIIIKLELYAAICPYCIPCAQTKFHLLQNLQHISLVGFNEGLIVFPRVNSSTYLKCKGFVTYICYRLDVSVSVLRLGKYLSANNVCCTENSHKMSPEASR